MIKHGVSPFLECSSRGDRRFSAFYARVNGVSIEGQYQAKKLFANGDTKLSWREAKGRKAINMDETAALYSSLWDQYIAAHPELLDVIKAASGLSDLFGQPGHQCQATELWRIKMDMAHGLPGPGELTIAEALQKYDPAYWITFDRMYSNADLADIPWDGDKYDSQEEACTAGEEKFGVDRACTLPLFDN
jgi:hypothetical protein